MGVTTHSKNPEAAKAFVEWFYSEDWYPEYLAYISSSSSMTNFPKEKDPILAEADTLCKDKQIITYDGGGDDFTAIQNETTFDYKKLGAEMLTGNFDLDRKNYIIRRASNLSKQSHILAANLDQCMLIVTINYPETSTIFIDRFLATAEAYRVPVKLIFKDRKSTRRNSSHNVASRMPSSA